jgi:predicted  nucleic acid-binding Zn-ribbon protein
MHMRHRIPTIFNLSMVDVLCCALGCVILMWLINYREAKRRAAAAGETTKLLATTRTNLAAARTELDGLRKKHGETQAALAAANNTLAISQRDLYALKEKHVHALAVLAQARESLASAKKKHGETVATLTVTRSQLAGLEETIKALQAQNAETSAGLKVKTKEQVALALKLAAAERTLTALDKEIAGKKTELAALSARVDDLAGRLLASQELVGRLKKSEASLKTEAGDVRDRLATAEARLLRLGKDLAGGKKALTDADRRILELLAAKAALEEKLGASAKSADRRIVELLAEKALLEQKLSASGRTVAGLEAGAKALKGQLAAARAVADNRFAGLELTGKKVVFLIDISGSMKRRDEATLSPAKWPAVCETVGKLVRSLPDLTHFQVILFSDSTKYLLGHDGEWLVYDAATSPGLLVEALKKVDPDGGTKMAPAFAEVFRFRPQGLDTVYFFSDGLPNEDDNLAPEVARLPEGQLSTYLSNRIRQTLKTVWNRPEPGRPAVRINAVGFFFDTPEVGAFLWALAREHDGGFVGMSRP